MLLRRLATSAGVIFLLWLQAVGLAHAESSGTTLRLFQISRSTNANVVCYDAHLSEDGLLRAGHPVSAYWLMKAKDGSRQELTPLERAHAYGFSVTLNPTRSSATLKLQALPARALFVSVDQGQAIAEVEISGKRAILLEVYVQAGKGLLPRVDWVKLTGMDPASGETVTEMVRP